MTPDGNPDQTEQLPGEGELGHAENGRVGFRRWAQDQFTGLKASFDAAPVRTASSLLLKGTSIPVGIIAAYVLGPYDGISMTIAMMGLGVGLNPNIPVPQQA